MTEALSTTLDNDRTGPVLSIGEVLVDLIVDDGATGLETARSLAVRDGGAPANVAVALARLGVPSAFCGVVGDDPFGARLRAMLAGKCVDVSRLRATDAADTTLALAWKDARGDGHFQLLRMADRLLDDDDIAAAGIGDVAAVVVGSVALSAEPSRGAIHRAAEVARGASVPVVFDVNIRPTLWRDQAEAQAACAPVLAGATVLKLSLDDARWLLNTPDDPLATLDQLHTLTSATIVLTDGARGCWTTEVGGAVIHVPAFTVAAIEPTGAGDAFTAALISRLVASNWATPTADDLRFAAASGALATTKHGALDGLPTQADLATFLAHVS